MTKKNKALFIDIDGVVIFDPNYLSKISEIEFLPNALKALKMAEVEGYKIIFISNKGGVFAKKGLNQDDLAKIDQFFIKSIVDFGISKSAIATYYCTHYPPEECLCRKPKNGLFKKAIIDNNVDVMASYAIGDKVSDLTPALDLGCSQGILVKRNLTHFEADSSFHPKQIMLDSLYEAINYLVKNENKSIKN